MVNVKMDRDQWVEVFRAAGLDEKLMQRWHSEFEQRYPTQHQAFLEWIQLPAEDIRNVRSQSKVQAA